MKAIHILLAMLLVASVSAFDIDTAADLSPKDVMALKGKVVSQIPASYQLAEDAIRPMPTRFLLYTKEGTDIMWGAFANGYFKGQDNHDKNTWGIYGKTVFAGFYDGEFFWGQYRNGNWKAYGLFGKNIAIGKYVVFPRPTLSAVQN
ncbi:MAG: hypothetical protein ABIJ34_01255 [archaeon]